MTHTAEFTVRAGERVPFVLTWFPSHEARPEPVDAEDALADTETVLARLAARLRATAGDTRNRCTRR